MKLSALLAVVASVSAVDFGTYVCNNNCATTEKYGKVIEIIMQTNNWISKPLSKLAF